MSPEYLFLASNLWCYGGKLIVVFEMFVVGACNQVRVTIKLADGLQIGKSINFAYGQDRRDC